MFDLKTVGDRFVQIDARSPDLAQTGYFLSL